MIAFGVCAPAQNDFAPGRLIQEINCAEAGDRNSFVQFPENVSSVETILGAKCRVLPNKEGDAKYFAFRVGQGKNLKAGACYVLNVVLNVEFPDDKPRGFHILNRGCETTRGVVTGRAVGDVLAGKYVNHNPESLDYPLSGKLVQWRSLFFLHDRFPEINQPRGMKERPMLPADGFWVIIAQVPARNDPMSAGAAVSKIRLYEAEDFSKYRLAVNLPPDGLPRRRIFWREEMADGVIAMGHKPEEKDEKLRGVKNVVDWYEYKAKLMQFLGINTFCKDLLEFGHNQGWDSTDGGGNKWYWQAPNPSLWSDTLTMLGKYNVDVIPYYEYAGSAGQNGLGSQGRCRSLGNKKEFTHISWTEKRNVDVVDKDFFEDARKLLDVSLIKYKDKVRFAGAWFRPRPSAIPISFNDLDLKTFAADMKLPAPPSREELKGKADLLEQYYKWWFGKRKEFLVALRDHLRKNISPDAVILFTADSSEPGEGLPSAIAGAGKKDSWTWKTSVVTDDTAAWEPILASDKYKYIKPLDYREVVSGNMHIKTLLRMRDTWGGWEWQHSCPPADPQDLKDTDGILFTYTFNRLYTVSTPAGFDAFRGPSGLAIVRHYPLNENEMFSGNEKEIVGYFVSDVERAGPYCMISEARAMANGDPTYIGYLMGNSYQRGFPEYVRAFNAAFLALPALPSVVDRTASADPDVVVRLIKTPKHGTYAAIINTSLKEKPNAIVKLPPHSKAVDAVTMKPLRTAGASVSFPLYPGELRSLRLE